MRKIFGKYATRRYREKTGELAARLDGILGRGDDQHCTRSESLQRTLEETIRVLKDAKERGQPRDQPEGASQDQPWGDVVVTAADAAVAAADWRAGLLSSRALFCVELAVDAAGRATHATMAALGKGAQEFFQSSPWGDMHGHVFYNLIHPEDRPKLDALLRQHAHGTGQGSVTRLRLVHFRTCQLEMNLWNQVPAHDASLAAANSAPDTGWPPSWDNVLPDDPLLDDAAGAVPRCTPSGMGDVKVTRGKTFFTAAHIALDFQLVAKHDAGGGLAGGIMVVMAPLHTATPPLRSCSAHLVATSRTWCEVCGQSAASTRSTRALPLRTPLWSTVCGWRPRAPRICTMLEMMMLEKVERHRLRRCWYGKMCGCYHHLCSRC
eukprot:Tamp_11454.p1 GENE.Tamp_11454~~Tamp_11454.p1  ORF type:complete len:379 (+),score=43.58 Tamp_11454:153-1289(+)